MNEDDFLKSFAKLLGPEANEALNKQIEAKKKERALLESFSASLSRVADFKIDVEDEPPPAPVILAKPIEPEVIEEAVEPIVEPVVEEITIPAEVPTDDLITKAVTNISKAKTQKDVQDIVDKMPQSIRKELDILKKSVLDLHSFAKRQSQMGGGGEVNFRYLDDVNNSTMEMGNDNWVLEYDASSKKVQFTENVGPIRTLMFNQVGPSTSLVAGQLGWNIHEDCLDVKHADGSTLQVGLENYIQVQNLSGSLMTNGSVVRFGGVDVDHDHPTAVLHLADGSVPPLYVIGVLTNDIPDQGYGRATVLGKVHNMDTTGATSGETWNAGDILYVSPTLSGKLTAIKPTAPNIVTPVAAVIKKDATSGILLVRPSIFPRLYYGSFSYTNGNQTVANTSTPYAVYFNSTDIASGHSIASNSHIVAQNSGLYNYQFSIQFISTNAAKKDVWVWARKNGTDIPSSASRLTISGNDTHTIAAWNFIVSMAANNYFQLMWAVSDTAISITSPTATAFCPTIPGVILTVTEAAL